MAPLQGNLEYLMTPALTPPTFSQTLQTHRDHLPEASKSPATKPESIRKKPCLAVIFQLYSRVYFSSGSQVSATEDVSLRQLSIKSLPIHF